MSQDTVQTVTHAYLGGPRPALVRRSSWFRPKTVAHRRLRGRRRDDALRAGSQRAVSRSAAEPDMAALRQDCVLARAARSGGNVCTPACAAAVLRTAAKEVHDNSSRRGSHLRGGCARTAPTRAVRPVLHGPYRRLQEPRPYAGPALRRRHVNPIRIASEIAIPSSARVIFREAGSRSGGASAQECAAGRINHLHVAAAAPLPLLGGYCFPASCVAFSQFVIT